MATLETERVYSFYPGALHGAIKFKMKTPPQTPKLYDKQWDDSEDGEEECAMRAVYVLEWRRHSWLYAMTYALI